MAAGVSLYGGFIGTETAVGQRDWITNATIIDGNGAIHTVTGATGAVLDGFTITAARHPAEPMSAAHLLQRHLAHRQQLPHLRQHHRQPGLRHRHSGRRNAGLHQLRHRLKHHGRNVQWRGLRLRQQSHLHQLHLHRQWGQAPRAAASARPAAAPLPFTTASSGATLPLRRSTRISSSPAAAVSASTTAMWNRPMLERATSARTRCSWPRYVLPHSGDLALYRPGDLSRSRRSARHGHRRRPRARSAGGHGRDEYFDQPTPGAYYVNIASGDDSNNGSAAAP